MYIQVIVIEYSNSITNKKYLNLIVQLKNLSNIKKDSTFINDTLLLLIVESFNTQLEKINTEYFRVKMKTYHHYFKKAYFTLKKAENLKEYNFGY